MASCRNRERGAATVEFYVVAFFVLIPMIMAILQLGMFFIAKNTVNLATFAAARAGAASGGDKSAMRNQFTKGLAPLYANTTSDVSNGNYTTVMGEAYVRAGVDVINPVFTRIDILNPTSASFADFGVANPAGAGRVIPTTNLMNDTRVGAQSRQTRSDALLLKIQTRYCYKMIFPVIDKLVTSTLLTLGASPADAACYALNRIPIASQAVIRMTEPPESGKIL